jgi:hypothetical protein
LVIGLALMKLRVVQHTIKKIKDRWVWCAVLLRCRRSRSRMLHGLWQKWISWQANWVKCGIFKGNLSADAKVLNKIE